jgi:hypothetical protein
MNNLALSEIYFSLTRNLTDEEKIELIAKISNSLIRDKKKKKREQTREEILVETYGSFVSDKSADEIIDEIYNSRTFIDKDHSL